VQKNKYFGFSQSEISGMRSTALQQTQQLCQNEQ